MGLIATIEKIFKRPNTPGRPVKAEIVSPQSISIAKVRRGLFSNSIWQADPERRTVYDDIENMDANDGVTAQALDTIAEVAIGLEDGFTDKFSLTSENKEVLAILNECVERLKLRRDAKDIIRKMVKHGSEFRELVVGQDMDGRIKILKLRGDLPCYTFYPNLDQNDDVNPAFPWVQKVDPWFVGKPIQFRSWQLCHWLYGERKMHVSVPFLASARRNWKLLQFLEDTMALARGTRAYMKLVHKVPVSPKATTEDMQKAVENYKKNMEKKEFYDWAQGHSITTPDPLSIESDMYIPEDGTQRGGVEVVDPKNQSLQQIDDVIYAQSKHVSRLGVPRAYLNIEGANSGALNQSDSSGKTDKHFARKIRDVQSAFIDGLMFLFNVELLFAGIKPYDKSGRLIYSIRMTKVNTEDAYNQAKAEQTFADALNSNLKVLEMPEGFIKSRYLRMNEEEEAKWGAEIKVRAKPNPAMQTGGANGPTGNGDPSKGGGAPRGGRPGSTPKSK